MDESAEATEETPRLKYPKPLELYWWRLSGAAKTILLQFGKRDFDGHTRYEDRLIAIDFIRGTGTRSSHFEVIRKKMPGHPEEHLRGVSNPFYMESGGIAIRWHGEGQYVYRYILELEGRNNPNPDDWGILEESLWI